MPNWQIAKRLNLNPEFPICNLEPRVRSMGSAAQLPRLPTQLCRRSKLYVKTASILSVCYGPCNIIQHFGTVRVFPVWHGSL